MLLLILVELVKPRAVCLFYQRVDGLILAVSRKHDATKFGLPGGKVDPGESDPEAIRREVMEETGLLLTDETEIFSRHSEGSTVYITTVFTGTLSGEIKTQESGVVKWVTPAELIAGPFGKYNIKLFQHLKII